MADFTLNVDGRGIAAPQWLNFAFTSGFTLNVDGLGVVVPRWLNLAFASGIGYLSAQIWYTGTQRPSLQIYKMRGMDALTNSLYDSWLSSGTPDTTGALYTGSLTTPLRDIIVVSSWTA